MQGTQPRRILASLQVGLGVQLHHHFASRFQTIDTLNKYGLCCSYSEVTKFECNAVVAQCNRYSRFAHYVADNVDHNIQTIDGMNIFYGMEMIADTTPANANDQMHSRQCSRHFSS